MESGPRLALPKIAFYNHTGEVSGAEIVLLSILNGLDRSRFTPVLLSPRGALVSASASTPHRSVPVLEARFTTNPVDLARYLGNVFRTVRTIRAALRAEDPDLVHANSVRAGIVATFATIGLGLPVVWHIHDILPRHAITTAIRTVTRVFSGTKLLAVSHATARSFMGLSSAKPVTVIYNSVDTNFYRPDPIARERVRHELNLTDQHVAIGVIGQITERKGQLELVEAFSIVRDRLPNAILLIIGAPQFNEKNRAYAAVLSRRIRQLRLEDQVLLIGKRHDMPAVMNAIDLLAQNSSVEPLGMALLEGFATERTAAAVGVDGVCEIVDDGLTALLAPPRDPAALLRKIETLVNDPDLRERMGHRARLKVTAQFGSTLQMEGMHAFYSDLLGIPSPVQNGKVLA